jgi:glutamine amidotransferase
MQVLFDGSAELSVDGQERGLGQWPGVVERLVAPVVPHMGWSRVKPAQGSRLFAGVEDARFYFVHSYAALQWELEPQGSMAVAAPKVSWSEHGSSFVAAVENGPLVATQFHPEKSGDAGAHLLENWVATL